MGGNRKGKATKEPQPLPDYGIKYRYFDKDGAEVLVKHRYDRKDGTKNFNQWTPVGDGLYIPGKPDRLIPLFRLLELKPDGIVYVTEGEKACLAGVDAWPNRNWMTFAGGSETKIDKIDLEPLAGRTVVLLCDGDDSGRKCMTRIADHLHSTVTKDVRIYYTPGDDGNDLHDWVQEGKKQAVERIKGAVPYIPSTKTGTGKEDPLTLNNDIDAKLALVGGDVDEFLNSHGEGLLKRATGMFWAFSQKMVVSLWISGRLLTMFKETIPYGEWQDYLKERGWSMRRSRTAMKIYRLQSWEDVQTMKTQTEALGVKPKTEDDEDGESDRHGGTTPEYLRGGDRQKDVETIRALRKRDREKTVKIERLEQDVERWKGTCERQETEIRSLKKTLDKILNDELMAGKQYPNDPVPF